MSKRDELISLYETELREKCGVEPDMDLLKKVTIGLGPSIYNKDSSTVSGSSKSEMDRVRQNFLTKKLGLTEADDIDGGLDAAINTYGKSNRTKYRAVFYYLLTKHFGKEMIYG